MIKVSTCIELLRDVNWVAAHIVLKSDNFSGSLFAVSSKNHAIHLIILPRLTFTTFNSFGCVFPLWGVHLLKLNYKQIQ